MDYPFISKNNQPIVPGNNIYYHSRRYGEVFGEVVKCILTRHYSWTTDPVDGKFKRVDSAPVARITAYVQTKPDPKVSYAHSYTTVISPKAVMLVI